MLKFNKYITVLLVACTLEAAYAEEAVAAKIAVVKGKVAALGGVVPVIAGVKEVEVGDQSLSYSLTVKNERQMFATVKKLESFYRGKKIFGKKAPRFVKDEQPGHAVIPWVSRGCKPGEAGPVITITGDRRELTVSVWIQAKCDNPQ